MIDAGALSRSLRGLRGPPGVRGLRTSPARADRRGRARRNHRVAVTALVTGVLAAVLVGGWAWVRDSSLVSVQRVTVTGLLAPDAEQIRSALSAAARGMSTLHVRVGTLRSAVSPYPVVKDLRVSTQFPHGLRIRVIEQVPVALVTVGGRAIPASADGTLLRDMGVVGQLPMIAVKAAPGGQRLQDPTARMQLRLLAAAPYPLLGRLAAVTNSYWHGLVVALRQGPSIFFGSETRLAAKWQAAVAVLAAPQSAGASYIDVSDPQRPAAGTDGSAGG